MAQNFAALHAAGARLGVPPMLSPDDYLQDGPDELCALLCMGLMASSLLTLTSEQRAAHTIAMYFTRRLAWRPGKAACHYSTDARAMSSTHTHSRCTSLMRDVACMPACMCACVRAARLRAALERWKAGQAREAAATTIQAHWRARKHRLRCAVVWLPLGGR